MVTMKDYGLSLGKGSELNIWHKVDIKLSKTRGIFHTILNPASQNMEVLCK